ncbi:ABC transporter permease [Halobacillus halophilus]|uniref:ABC-type transport system permease protein n=1 Tax=Halobacillus halophilus (strain ATCC 35676 / DSM 2266 / JCM 20832 / KCTC 3685 / LMG 17431 / NBRC 102448 / NCIMB 2269) TaxID=866895 RepID=I0JL36_HALH3|nr:hypothetical protein [Halobacillus halophilus]ASF38979.1 ABC transporter permease [Halobacillus halophilus]CCG44856.1 hypothetical protein HBHAL_2511 [Halobacillus halophilus DSM 2266]
MLLSREIKGMLSPLYVFTYIAIILIPILIAFYQANNYILFKPIDFFTLTLEGMIPMVFPLICVSIFLIQLAKEKTNNFLLYTRSRTDLGSYLRMKFFVNATLVFTVVFLMVFVPFFIAFYIDPLFGHINYYPVDNIENVDSPTFSQLLNYGSLVYGLGYAFWVAINGVVYASLSFALLFLLSNNFLAMSLPFVIYHAGNFVLAIMDLEVYSLISTIFPFNISQQPIWTALIPFLCLTALLFILLFIMSFKIKRLDVIL